MDMTCIIERNDAGQYIPIKIILSLTQQKAVLGSIVISMKRTIIYRVTAILMALLIGMTSIGMTLNMHFCGGSLKSISLIQSSGSCCSAVTKSCGNIDSVQESEGKKCCDNQSIEIQSDDNLIIDQVQVLSDINKFDVLITNNHVLDHLNIVAYDAADFEHYRPPLVSKDIPILFESFLL